MKSENRVPSIQDSALRTRHSALRWGVAMKQLFSILLVVAVGVVAAIAPAQQAKSDRLAVLVVGSAYIPQIKGVRDGLQELGYIQGKNLALDIVAKDSYAELRPLVKSYKEKKLDAIVSIGVTATGVVKEIAPEIPTVFYFGSDPVQAGFVKSIARPETNLTGLTLHADP